MQVHHTFAAYRSRALKIAHFYKKKTFMIFFFSTFYFPTKSFLWWWTVINLIYFYVKKSYSFYSSHIFFCKKSFWKKKTIIHLEGATTHITYLMLYPHSVVTGQFLGKFLSLFLNTIFPLPQSWYFIQRV